MISVRTPFRLPLGGGGTDLPAYSSRFGGSLVTAAVNKYMIINLNISALVDRIRIAYSKTESVAVDQVESIEHDIVRESLKELGIQSRLDIASMADLPAGTGMGSSSSFTVGLLHALQTHLGRPFSKKDLAELASHIEMDRCQKPIGKQDQYAAAFGGIIRLDIARDGAVTVERLQLESEVIHELEYRLVLFYTGQQRDANAVLSEQSSKASSDDATVTEAMHSIKEIGLRSYEALNEGNIDAFGRLLDDHWQTKKNISEKMSNPQLDRWYTAAKKHGALGGKIMGAGGGGLFMFCLAEGARREFRTAMIREGLTFLDFRFDWEGSKLLVNF